MLVAATDGVLDNLFDVAIQLTVARSLDALRSPSGDAGAAQRAVDELARSIAEQAAAMGARQDEEGLATPFSEAAGLEGYRFDGGKLDDVAVVCGVVRDGAQERAPARLLSNFQ